MPQNSRYSSNTISDTMGRFGDRIRSLIANITTSRLYTCDVVSFLVTNFAVTYFSEKTYHLIERLQIDTVVTKNILYMGVTVPTRYVLTVSFGRWTLKFRIFNFNCQRAHSNCTRPTHWHTAFFLTVNPSPVSAIACYRMSFAVQPCTYKWRLQITKRGCVLGVGQTRIGGQVKS